MASQWRIHHKLMLGLGLMVAVIALLISGAAYGFCSYYLTTNSIKAKSAELMAAEELKAALYKLMDPYILPDLVYDNNELEKRLTEARQALEAYEERLRESLSQENDAETASASEYVALIREQIGERDAHGQWKEGKFRSVLADANKVKPAMMNTSGLREKIRKELQNVVAPPRMLVEDLRKNIKDQLERTLASTRRHYQVSLWIIIPATIVALLIPAGVLRSFYDWILHPIRELQAGVQRVALGDFDRRIAVNSGDEMQELAAAFNDMTQRLDNLYKDLARQVNERSRQLVRSERLASVGFLAAGVAHEINNPLAIAFCSEALESRLHDLLGKLPDGGQKEVFVKYLKMIQEEAFRCKNITERLLAFSRSGERKREPVDLGVLVQSVLDVTQHLQNSRGKQIDFVTHAERVPSGRILAPVNAEEIKSVILNLVVNALDSMDGGGTLTIRLGQQEGLAYLEFTDTGCGMTQEVLENIFEPFFTRSRTGKGTGLGLTISHRIVNQHGGDIEAASPGPGLGSTFTIRLPLQAPESAGLASGY